MTRWTRDERVPHKCGQCGTEIPIGEIFLLFTFNGVLFKRYRCQVCAGPTPPDQPTTIVEEEHHSSPRPDFTRVVDVKRRASGDDAA